MTTQQGAIAPPLKGVTVVELGQAIAGPFASQLLADMGARVIKIERLSGDDSRGLPPYFVGDSSAYFLASNRSKESIALDLKRPEAVRVALDIIGRADIVIENNRPGVLDRMGLTFEAMKAANPRIVLCSITGFGQDGPYSNLPAYDMIVQALSGGMSVTGEVGGRPVRSGMAIGDLAAAMMASLSAVSALRAAETTGQAQRIDVSMLDVQVALLNYKFVYHLMFGVMPEPEGRDHSGIAEMGAFECSDGREVLMAPLAETMWDGLCRALDRLDLVDHPACTSRIARNANKDFVRAELARSFLQGTSDHWLARLQANSVPSATINTLDQVARDPQIRHRDMIFESSYAGEPARLIGSPVKFEGVTQEYRSPPRLGEHTISLLREIGLGEEAAAALVQDKIAK